MLRSKDTWGEGNGEWDENYFGSFGKKKLQNPFGLSSSRNSAFPRQPRNRVIVSFLNRQRCQNNAHLMKPIHHVGGFYSTESDSMLSSRSVVTELKTVLCKNIINLLSNLANDARADGSYNYNLW